MYIQIIETNFEERGASERLGKDREIRSRIQCLADRTSRVRVVCQIGRSAERISGRERTIDNSQVLLKYRILSRSWYQVSMEHSWTIV